MKSIYAVAAVAMVAGAVLVGAIAAGAPNRPPGVSADAWAPISDTVGVVLVAQMTPAGEIGASPDPGIQARQVPHAEAGGAILIPPTTGYLMVKRGGIWQRLILIEPLKGPGSAG